MEMEDLSQDSRQKTTFVKDHSRDIDGMTRYDPETAAVADNTIILWAYVQATWFILLSLPLLAFPRFLLFLASASEGDQRYFLTPLESFLSTHFGILLLSLAVGILTSIPNNVPTEPRQGKYTHPLLLPLTCGSLLTSFLSYNTPASSVGPITFIVALGAGGTGIWGVWVFLFAGSSLISRKTGADKRTSRFLFGNHSAASAQKKRWKNEREAR